MGEHLELPRHHRARPPGRVGGLARGLPADPALPVVELARRVPARRGDHLATGLVRSSQKGGNLAVTDGVVDAGESDSLGIADSEMERPLRFCLQPVDVRGSRGADLVDVRRVVSLRGDRRLERLLERPLFG